MGVDRILNFGIGFKIDADGINEMIKNNAIDSHDVYEFLYDKLYDKTEEEDKYKLIQVGAAAYSGGCNDFYVIISHPFTKGYDNIKEQGDELANYLRSENVPFLDKLDLYGGIHVC